SYIPARTFSFALLNVVADRAGAAAPTKPLTELIEAATLPASLERILSTLARSAGNDIEKFQQSLNAWFDDAMERVSGAYRRRTQLILFVISLFVTAYANANSIEITRRLSRDASARAALVAAAEAYAAQPADSVPATTGSPTERVDSVVARLEGMGLPIGWDAVPASVREAGPWAVIRHRAAGLTFGQLIGLLLTTFAVSLGAPFWFDVLNRIVNIRSAGRAPEEKPKPPEKLPPAR
ncbi:MAG: hypothetical protein ACRELX_12460, partial [Longimicrobiales bacterium]